MAADQADVIRVIEGFLERVSKPPAAPLTAATELYSEDGAGLDSLDTAELSAVLEDEFGSDPFSTDEMPQTVGDLVDYLAGATADG
jgi:acyl carrier protein